MSNDQERTRRVRQAYENAQRAAGELAVSQAMQAAAQEKARIAQNIPCLAGAKDAALIRLERAGFPGSQLVTLPKPTMASRILKHVNIGEQGRETVVGWHLLSVDQGSSHSPEFYTRDYYLLADNSYCIGGKFGNARVDIATVAAVPQEEVLEVMKALEGLAPSQQTQ